eukprot:CAMPEP_0197034808 /NCGR_PEP_ID=MMETSP1384-20130603/12777_1 /TAXON_ID=29189 /ORGANISM="Ammonia sp." /LENGTH=625 /DNA_ID=CAMNT_0042464767 /DNA_START=72 /DNA_END=1949 /DNA_ORIENTATION=+
MATVDWETNADPEPEEQKEEEWGWDAVSKWWNSSCNDGCKKAERGLIKAFVDTEIYEYKSAQVPIDYDAEPISVKQKKLKRSRTFSFFSSPSNTNDNEPIHRSFTTATRSSATIPRVHEQKQKQNQQPSCKKEPFLHKSEQSKSPEKSLFVHQELIHTLSFRIKPDKLQTLKDRLYASRASNNDNDASSDTDSDEESKQPPLDANALNNRLQSDGQHIQGRSMGRFFQRTDTQEASSTLPLLQKQIAKCTKRKLRAQQQQEQANAYPDILSQKQIPPIVLSHGYGCAGGIFIPSIPTIYETLLSHLDLEEAPVIHVFDWLGGGMSSRPQFQCEDTQEAEDWFVESLEAWRKAMGIGKMILSAHSMGGYAVCCYALRYPQFVEHLILISPCGIPGKPDDAEKMLDNYSWKIRTMFKTFGKLWDSGWTPHDIIRMSGPKARGICEKIVNKRLFRLDENDPLKPLLAEYLYHVVAQPGSGEYALNKILAPGAWARNPLSKRMGALKVYQREVTGYDLIADANDDDGDKQAAVDAEEEEKKDENDEQSESSRIDVDQVLNTNMKIDFIYGTTDWMTSGHAVKVKLDGVVKCEVYITPDCGHQLVLENRQGFAQLFGAVVAKGQIISASQ